MSGDLTSGGRENGRCTSRPADISSPNAAWDSGRWPFPRSSATVAPAIAGDADSIPSRSRATGRNVLADNPMVARPGAFSGTGAERHLPVHGRWAESARIVRLQAPAPGI